MLNRCDALVDATCGLHVHFEIALDFDLVQFQNLIKLQLNLEDSFDCLVDFTRRYDNDFCKSNLKPFYECFIDEFGFDQDEILWTEKRRAELVRKAYTLLDDPELVKQFILGSKYHKLNMSAIRKHDTVEVRHHQGTLDLNEVVNWIMLQMALVEKAKSSTNVEPAMTFFDGPQKAFTVLSVNKKVIQYYLNK